MNLLFQAIGCNFSSRRFSNATWLWATLSWIGCLHKCIALVRRNIPLSIRLRRSFDSLLDDPSIATPSSGSRSFGDSRDNSSNVLRSMANLSSANESFDFAASFEKHLIGDRHNRWQRSDMLTKRQFCAIRRGRSCNHCVTITATGHRSWILCGALRS